MLRPATPLSVLLFAAFGLLLIAALSTPIIKAIPLGSFQDVDFGVFGICRGDECSGIEIGYDTTNLFDGDESRFDIPSSVRDSLSSVLIVHPVAALLTLVMFIMAAAAHIHSPSHSPRYLLILFILLILDSLLCILAFLVDVLLFTPHLAFGSYFVITAAILVSLSTVVSCAMRRTLMGRKARMKKIAQNAEMSGENYYNREAQKAAAAVARQPTMPMVSGANSGTDTLPTFASLSYDSQQKDDQVSDERIPLTQRSPSNRSPGIPAEMTAGNVGNVAMLNEPRRSSSVPPPQQDQYGNPNGPADAYGVRRGPSFDRMNSRGRGGVPPPGYRGRGGGGAGGGGGYGRGGYNGYPPTNRGGYGAPGRGGYGPPRGGYGGPPPRGGAVAMRGGSGRPPPGYNGAGPYNRQPSPADGYGPYGRQPTDPYGQGLNASGSMPNMGGGGYDAYPPSERSSLPRAESPPPLPGSTGPQQMGEVAEMDGTPTHAPGGFGNQYGAVGIRDSDTDVAGMVALQQPPKRVDAHLSDGSTSKYSNEEGDGQYVPPRAGWNQDASRNTPSVPAPLNINRSAEGPGRNSPPGADTAYYEDVEPRYAPRPPPQAQQPPLQVSASYENIHAEGARSPAESDRSNFTSISQRGVNPQWNPPPPMPGYQGQGPPPRRPPPQRQDMILNNNPNFQLQGGRPGQGGRGGPGMIPGSAYPGL